QFVDGVVGVLEGRPEIAAQHVGQPVSVLRRQRLVQAVALGQRRLDFGWHRLLAVEGTAGRGAQQQEAQRRQQPQGDERLEGAGGEQAGGGHARTLPKRPGAVTLAPGRARCGKRVSGSRSCTRPAASWRWPPATCWPGCSRPGCRMACCWPWW